MTLQTALQTSPNTGFVILEEQVGMDPVVDMAVPARHARDHGDEHRRPAAEPQGQATKELRISQTEFYKQNGGNASFTLSPAPVTTLELANVGRHAHERRQVVPADAAA